MRFAMLFSTTTRAVLVFVAPAGRVIEKILAHVAAEGQQPKAATLPLSRAPPQLEIDDDWL
jgi:hypothetical protein